jgi:hypothetical protein
MNDSKPSGNQIPIASHVSAAVEGYARRHSAALVLFFAENHVDVGSATCVRLGDRFLLATAGHNIYDQLRDEDIRIIAPLSTSEEQLPIIARHWLIDGHQDVGWLEISGAVAEHSGLTFLDAHMLAPFEEPSSESLYLAQGVPAQYSCVSGRTISLTSLGYMTIPAVRSDIDPDVELVLDYSEAESPLPIPKGMSGGGIWSIQAALAPLVWAPENSRLVGITKSWLGSSRHLLAVKVEHWLRLVSCDFSDLRDTIDEILRRRVPSGSNKGGRITARKS